ncbi:endonuclease/exonuclease/phosphatase family protein [Bacteroides ovatus]|nr:endonuclease/exonuclease/phosphatase family protein [Bacteroides ovatus]
MKKIVIYTLITFIFSVFASSCEDNKDNSLYYPDFTWDTGDGEEDEDPVTETSMRVATYNLQVETGTGWTNRRERVAQLIKDYDFEICGFEEASWEQRSYLGTQLASDYQILAYGRDTGNDDNKAGEMSGILYKKSRYTLLDAGRFWFSETPEIPSNGWDETNFKRFCVWGKFKDSKTQKEFYLFETHMPLADNARKHACQMLVDAVSDKAKDNTPAFCTGDFNATPDAPEIATTICQSGILKDAYREAVPFNTELSLHFLLKRPELILFL